ncbi:hypothetical protein HELRODRAFT_68922, partial [Helobdella robusta]|uniref:Uncharacterized protein n=1 Tax=Helobdella robusta TaxID=6412 RepID=T1FZL6_HELRO
LESGPLLAIETQPASECFKMKFSSGNVLPNKLIPVKHNLMLDKVSCSCYRQFYLYY